MNQLSLEGVEHREDWVDVFFEEFEVGVVEHHVVACVFIEFVVLSRVEVDSLLEDIDQVFNRHKISEFTRILRFWVDEDLTVGDHLVSEFSD